MLALMYGGFLNPASILTFRIENSGANLKLSYSPPNFLSRVNKNNISIEKDRKDRFFHFASPKWVILTKKNFVAPSAKLGQHRRPIQKHNSLIYNKNN